MKFLFCLFILFIPITTLFGQWMKSVNGLPSDRVSYACAFDDVIFVRALDSSGAVSGTYWSFDNGDSWSYRSNNYPGWAFKNRLIRYLSSDSIKISLDSGLTFISANLAKSEVIPLQIKNVSSDNSNAEYLIDFNDTAILCVNSGYYKSSDYGINWTFHFKNNYPFPLRVMSYNDSLLYFITVYFSSGDYYSDIEYLNSSGNYILVKYHTSPINDAMFVKNKLLFLTVGGTIIDSGISYTIPALFGMDTERDPNNCVSYGDSMFVSIYDFSANPFNSVYAANINDYYTWTLYNDGFTSDPGIINQLFVHKNYLFAVADSGFFRRELTPISNIKEHTPENEISIFPNPASTQVNLCIQVSDKTKIVIHDVFGREIYVNKVQNTGTNVTETIDVSGWAKGMYIVKINTDEGIKTGKLIVE